MGEEHVEGRVAGRLVVGLLTVITRAVGEGSTKHCDPILVFPMMVLDRDGGCVIWLRLGEDDGGSWWLVGREEDAGGNGEEERRGERECV